MFPNFKISITSSNIVIRKILSTISATENFTFKTRNSIKVVENICLEKISHNLWKSNNIIIIIII